MRKQYKIKKYTHTIEVVTRNLNEVEKMKAKIICLASICLLMLGCTNIKKQDNKQQLELNATAALMIDVNTQEVLYEKRPDQKVPVASLVKLLVAYTVYDAIKNGDISWTDTFTLSDYGLALTNDVALSNAPMHPGQKYTVKELVEGMLITSGNNCALTLAEGLSGDEAHFIEKMKQHLSDWGIKNYQLVNVTGLDNASLPPEYRKTQQANQFSAKDLVTIAGKLITDFPEVLAITKQPTMNFSGIPIYTYNQLLPGEAHAYAGVDGLKTGTTASAGACIMSTSNKNGRRILTVVLGAKTDEDRYKDTKKLLDSL